MKITIELNTNSEQFKAQPHRELHDVLEHIYKLLTDPLIDYDYHTPLIATTGELIGSVRVEE